MQRHTKIIATIGPATEDPKILKELILAGVNLIRINMSHGTNEDHLRWLHTIKNTIKNLQKEVGILIDLQGPKLRIARFKQKKIELQQGDHFTLDATLAHDDGTKTAVGIDYKELPNDVKPGDVLLFDDGRIEMDVVKVQQNSVECVVKVGGPLSDHKGFNRLGGGLSAKAFTEKDHQDLLFAIEHEADYIALSFPRSAEDILQVKKIIQDLGSHAGIIAKIERVEAVTALDQIILASDAVMVARGDLGVEIGFAELPAIQKLIIQRAKILDRAVITATQMMESMITNSIPTRAEVSDIANAVLEGTDAVMLSAETATGQYPIQTVTSMAQICLAAEKQKFTTAISQQNITINNSDRIDKAIAMATMYTARNLKVKAIIALTESGSTALSMSRIGAEIPIYGISRNKHARGKMTLYCGVFPIDFDITKYKPWEIIREITSTLQQQKIISINDKVITTSGDILGITGFTNTMKIITVGEHS